MLSPQIILFAIAAYFIVLTAISYLTGKEDNNEVFFNAKRKTIQTKKPLFTRRCIHYRLK